MKPWMFVVIALCAAGALFGAGFLALRAQANAEAMTNALALAERPHAQASATPTPPKPPAAAPAPVATPAPAATPAADPPHATVAFTTPPPAPAPAAPSASGHDSADAPAAENAPATPTGNFKLGGQTFARTATFNGAPVYVPKDCKGAYDVVLHFHGAHPYVIDLVEKAHVHAVVGVFNAGNGAEKYGQAFGTDGVLTSLLKQVEAAAAPLCQGADAKPQRVALTAWSAGYAATEKLVSRPSDRDRVDAILLADGLHAGFINRYKRQFAPNALEPFREFGLLAKAGQKLFAITHSTIVTDGYGSTTECSRLLLSMLDVECKSQLVSGGAGSFSIEGFTGDDKAAHILQFRQMDRTLFSKLRERWAAH